MARSVAELVRESGPRTVLAGDSAGAQIAFTAALQLREQGWVVPRTILISPPIDMELVHDELAALLGERSLYDEVLAWLSRHGYAVPAASLKRDWALPYSPSEGVVDVVAEVYADPSAHWDVYEMCEELVDVEESFQLWRFRHMKTVERIIGYKRGTGGSSGVGFLRAALDLTFFPELLDVRTEIGA